MHIPHTITSLDGHTRAVIVPSLGFTCIEFVTQAGGQSVSVLVSEPDILSGNCRPGRSGIPILFPFPNRIRHGRFEHRGKVYEVPPPAWFPQTIHGFCVDRAWRVIDSTPHSLTGEFLLSRDAPERRRQWPADARLVVTYSVETARLRADITVENPDSVPLPWGFGTHPYFQLPLGAGCIHQLAAPFRPPLPHSGVVSESQIECGGEGAETAEYRQLANAPLGTGHPPESCTIRAAASQQWQLDLCFPTGQRVPVPAEKDLRSGWRYGSCSLDDVYTDLTPIHGSIVQVIDDPVSQLRMTQRSCEEFRELVVFTPKDRAVICLEPYTCTTDAANLQSRGLDAGWRELAPGEQQSLWFELQVSPLESSL